MKKILFLLFISLLMFFPINTLEVYSTEEKPIVIFIPGIMGSSLEHEDYGEIWFPLYRQISESIFAILPKNPLPIDIYSFYDPANNYFHFDKLLLNDFGYSNEPIFPNGILGRIGYDIYNSFVNKLEELRINEDIESYRVISVDWRKSADDLDEYVYNEISDLITYSKNNGNKLIIIGHSQGGLISKLLIDKFIENNEDYLIDDFIMVATPQLGSVKAITALLHGEILSSISLVRNEMRELSYNLPGVYDLLPNLEYYKRTNEPVIIFDHSIIDMKERFPWIDISSDIIENYHKEISDGIEISEFLLGDGIYLRPNEELPYPLNLNDPIVVNENIFNQELPVRQKLKIWTPPINIETYQIAGIGQNTVASIEYFATNNNPFDGLIFPDEEYFLDYNLKYTKKGDGTVHKASSLSLDTPNTFSYIVDVSPFGENKGHDQIMSSEEIQELIERIILNEGEINLGGLINIQKDNGLGDYPIIADYQSDIIITIDDYEKDDLPITDFNINFNSKTQANCGTWNFYWGEMVACIERYENEPQKIVFNKQPVKFKPDVNLIAWKGANGVHNSEHILRFNNKDLLTFNTGQKESTVWESGDAKLYFYKIAYLAGNTDYNGIYILTLPQIKAWETREYEIEIISKTDGGPYDWFGIIDDDSEISLNALNQLILKITNQEEPIEEINEFSYENFADIAIKGHADFIQSNTNARCDNFRSFWHAAEYICLQYGGNNQNIYWKSNGYSLNEYKNIIAWRGANGVHNAIHQLNVNGYELININSGISENKDWESEDKKSRVYFWNIGYVPGSTDYNGWYVLIAPKDIIKLDDNNHMELIPISDGGPYDWIGVYNGPGDKIYSQNVIDVISS